jgi:hypothetical protein
MAGARPPPELPAGGEDDSRWRTTSLGTGGRDPLAGRRAAAGVC